MAASTHSQLFATSHFNVSDMAHVRMRTWELASTQKADTLNLYCKTVKRPG